MTRFIRAAMFIAFIFGAKDVFATGTNWYVLKGATGANNGTNWTNAWNEMSQINWSSVGCGDTVWLSGGSYTTAINIAGTKNCTAATVLNINRVLSADSVPVAAPGWNSSFDSQVVLPNITIVGPAAYITINGREWQGGVAGMGGIQVLIPGASGDGIDASNNGNGGPAIDHITWTYVEVYGPSCVQNQNCTSGGVTGINIMPYCSTGNRTNLLFDHVSIHQTGEAIRACGWNGATIQYSLIYDTHNDGQQHEDIQYSNPPYQNVTWKYNSIFDSPNDGIFFEGDGSAVNFVFMYNIFYHSAGWGIACKTGDSTCGPMIIVNNIFEYDGTDVGEGYTSLWFGSGGGVDLLSGSIVANNIWYQAQNQFSPACAPAVCESNAYSGSSFGSNSETGSFYFPASNPLNSFNGWVNMSSSNPIAANFNLTAAGSALFTGKGTNLGAPYNIDMNGNTQPASGAWTVGPYIYSGSQAQAPQPPTGLKATVQ
jgi:hypothetical protein